MVGVASAAAGREPGACRAGRAALGQCGGARGARAARPSSAPGRGRGHARAVIVLDHQSTCSSERASTIKPPERQRVPARLVNKQTSQTNKCATCSTKRCQKPRLARSESAGARQLKAGQPARREPVLASECCMEKARSGPIVARLNPLRRWH